MFIHIIKNIQYHNLNKTFINKAQLNDNSLEEYSNNIKKIGLGIIIFFDYTKGNFDI